MIFEQDIIHSKINNCPSNTDIDVILESLRDKYANKHDFESMKDKINDFVGREEFFIL